MSDPPDGLWSRLKKARILQVLALYLGGSWVVLQVVELFVDDLGVPDWATPVAVLLLLIGLLVVLATAWVQSHPLAERRAEAEEVPGRWEVELAGIKEAFTRGEVPHLTWARAALGGVLAFSLLFGFAGLYVVIQDRGRSFAPAPVVAEEAAPGIAVLPFSVRGEGMEIWREGIVDLLSTGLDGAAGLRAIDSRTLFARWRERVDAGEEPDLATALRVAEATGASYALVGSAVAIGPDVRLVADLYELSDGESLGEAQVEGDPEEVLSLADRLSVKVLGVVLSETGGELPSVRIAGVTTGSMPALKAFLAGEERFRHGDFGAAIREYERAVSMDSAFALAHYRLAQAWGWYDVEGGSMLDAIDRALRYADRLPAREALLARLYDGLLKGRLDVLEDAEDAAARYPDDVEVWHLVGEAYFHMGAEALVDGRKHVRFFRRAMELDPTFSPAYIHWIQGAFQEDADSAGLARRIERFADLSPGTATLQDFRLAFALAFGDSATRARALSGVDTTSIVVSRAVVPTLTHARHLDDAADALEAARRASSSRARTNAAGLLHLVELFRGRPSKALAVARSPELADQRREGLYHHLLRGFSVPDTLLERVFGELPSPEASDAELFYAGAYAAERGDRPALRSVVSRLESRAAQRLADGDSASARRMEARARAIEEYGGWWEGDRDRALETLVDAQEGATNINDPSGINVTIRWWIGNLLERQGRLREAVPYFRSLGPWSAIVGGPLAYYRLGRLHERLGEPAEAREAYEYFLLAWRHAEPAVRDRIEEVERRLARLE